MHSVAVHRTAEESCRQVSRYAMCRSTVKPKKHPLSLPSASKKEKTEPWRNIRYAHQGIPEALHSNHQAWLLPCSGTSAQLSDPGIGAVQGALQLTLEATNHALSLKCRVLCTKKLEVEGM